MDSATISFNGHGKPRKPKVYDGATIEDRVMQLSPPQEGTVLKMASGHHYIIKFEKIGQCGGARSWVVDKNKETIYSVRPGALRQLIDRELIKPYYEDFPVTLYEITDCGYAAAENITMLDHERRDA